MAVPKAAVNEDRYAVTPKDDIRSPWQIANMQPVA
jgi:hypothetical protein